LTEINGQEYGATTNREINGSLARLLVERAGDEGLEIIRILFGELGRKTGQKLKRDILPGDIQTAYASS